MTLQEELAQFAAVARRSVEPGLQQDVVGQPISAGACLHASMIVVMLLRRFGRGQAVIRGGGPPSAGALDASGTWRGHYWVEVRMPTGETFVLDVTADQFGYEPVVVLPLQHSLGRYRPGPQELADEALAELVQDFGCGDLLAA